MKYSKSIDKKWQKIWKETNQYKYNPDSPKKKLYTMEMFSYPSGANLHLGHWFNFAPADTFARFKNMQGYNVFHPMGFDAFGLPAENYAIKTGIHPEDSTIKNIETMKRQLEEMGATYDWNYSVETCMPDYYKWTQWIFLQLYKNGLAYQKEAPVNWCESCKTVLANEQVIDGHCERCGCEVIKKKLKQWFFKITDYADELIKGLDDLDWPEPTKKIQINWIGRSEGAYVTFNLCDSNLTFDVFTTRVDTLCGVTYVVLSPENDLVPQIVTPECASAVEEYKNQSAKLSEIDRMSTEREKTGVFTGAYAINPINQQKVPVWIGDYVIDGYGTGCVMAVPAHDTRDYDFAVKYNLPIVQVITNKSNDAELPFTDHGFLINSNSYNGLSTADAKKKIVEDLKKNNKGRNTVNYRLKDWLVSRQRYWGAPIPVIHCEKCGAVPVPEKDLPVKLPYDVEFKPDGESPLKKSKEFMNCTCPVCGRPALREADTLDTFVCSSWYFLRYPDAHNDKQAFNKDIVNKMLPVDVYVGGKEHAAMHLIYARFVTKALRDLGFLDFNEPFKRLIHQGMILGTDGNKMSKSKGNTVSPDVYIDQYGSDVFRLYLMFGFAYVDGGPWNDDGIKAMSRYISRISDLVENICTKNYNDKNTIGTEENKIEYVKNYTIKAIQNDIEIFQFNTAIARSMEYFRELQKYEASDSVNKSFLVQELETYITIMAPFIPHFAEEIWHRIGKTTSVHSQSWPVYDEEKLKLDVIEIPVQVNGKVKVVVSVDRNISEEKLLQVALNEEGVIKAIGDKNIIKKIYVKQKILTIVVK